MFSYFTGVANDVFKACCDRKNSSLSLLSPPDTLQRKHVSVVLHLRGSNCHPFKYSTYESRNSRWYCLAWRNQHSAVRCGLQFLRMQRHGSKVGVSAARLSRAMKLRRIGLGKTPRVELRVAETCSPIQLPCFSQPCLWSIWVMVPLKGTFLTFRWSKVVVTCLVEGLAVLYSFAPRNVGRVLTIHHFLMSENKAARGDHGCLFKIWDLTN